MNPHELNLHLDKQLLDLSTIRRQWQTLIPSLDISSHQLRLWLFLYEFSVVSYGIRELAKKYHRLHGSMDEDFAIKFASRCMSGRKRFLEAAKFNEGKFQQGSTDGQDNRQ